MHNLKLLTFTSLILLLSSCSKTNDFNTLCSYFDSLAKETSIDSMSPLDKHNFIHERVIRDLNSNSNARVSWEALVNFTPASGRYEMFIEAAKSSSHEAWECASMLKHIKSFPD